MNEMLKLLNGLPAEVYKLIFSDQPLRRLSTIRKVLAGGIEMPIICIDMKGSDT